MSTRESPAAPRDHGVPAEVDVLVVGAGLSGIGAACHLRDKLPHLRVAILEARGAMGGTWDLFRYPGVRSDSDMFTLGYRFHPWTDPDAIADGGRILDYIQSTARAYRVDELVHYHRRVVALDWDSEVACWTAVIERTDTGETEQVRARHVHACTGYYRYDEGYTPHLPGVEDFRGQLIHPQHWPEDLELAGRHVVVIGSGATAVTLVPALAAEAAHVTMLQRSPGYLVSLPSRDPLAALLLRRLPTATAAAITRWKSVLVTGGLYQLSRRRPRLVRRALRRRLQRKLPAHVDVDAHFDPSYDPWDQRLCVVPDDDLFDALAATRASVITDSIETFTETGIALGSGRHIEADVVVTATGLRLLMLGGLQLRVDGERIDPADTVAYKGMMLTGVPNLSFTVGYTNASWTLKADLVADYLCRLLEHMEHHDLVEVVPLAPGPETPLRPLIDLDAGYVRRSLHELPQQADRAPWQLHQHYLRDLRLFQRGTLDDAGVRFRARGSSPSSSPVGELDPRALSGVSIADGSATSGLATDAGGARSRRTR